MTRKRHEGGVSEGVTADEVFAAPHDSANLMAVVPAERDAYKRFKAASRSLMKAKQAYELAGKEYADAVAALSAAAAPAE